VVPVQEDATQSGQLTNGGAAAGPVTFAIVTQPTSGTLTLFEDTGAFEYVPNEDYVGEDSFAYTVTSDGVVSDPATITLTVANVNDAPTISSGALSSVEDGAPVTFDLTEIANDVDTNDTLSFEITSYSGEGNVTLTGVDSSTLEFDPGAGFQSLDSGQSTPEEIQITVRDAAGATAESTVTVTIAGADDPLTVTPDFVLTQGMPAVEFDGSGYYYGEVEYYSGYYGPALQGDYGPARQIDVLANDIGTGALSIYGFQVETYSTSAGYYGSSYQDTLWAYAGSSLAGLLTVTPDATALVFEPYAGFLGLVTFQYTAVDGSEAEPATTGVTVLVMPEPVFSADSQGDTAGYVSSESGSFGDATLTNFSVSLNGGTTAQITPSGNAAAAPLADIAGMADALGETNQITLTSSFETVFAGTTYSGTSTSITDFSKADFAENSAGTLGNDVLLGSDDGDTLGGAGGSDAILGFGGDDTISVSGSSAARVDGGDGFDILKLMSAGTFDTGELNAAFNISNIEGLDLRNDGNDAVTLGYDDIFGLTSDPVTPGLTVYLDAADTIELVASGVQEWQGPTEPSLSQTWQLVQGENILATLGIEITAPTAPPE